MKRCWLILVNNLINAVLLVVLLICFYTDIKEKKIYNKIIFPGLLAGLVLNLLQHGFSGLTFSLYGFLLGLGLLFLPFSLGGLGAGDVKLLGLVGIFKGAYFVINTFLLAAVLGGVFSIIVLVKKGMLLTTIKKIATDIKNIVVSLFKVNTFSQINKSSGSIAIPFAPAIVIGTLLSYFIKF